MSDVLYRKYRPQKFAEVINQQTVKTILQNALRSGRVSHAYLFTGPRGVGKTTIARILAKAVNCQKLDGGEPDMTCPNCKLFAEGRFLDLFEIDAASYTGVDNIREIIDHVKFSPTHGKYKVFIVDEVHMLSKAAFNALLKTLEEPPAHAIFILATTEIHKVPATIISRTQRFDFKQVAQKDILELFERVLADQKGVKVSLEAQKLIAESAGGSFRDALSILDQIMTTGTAEVTAGQVEDILGVARAEVSQKFLGLLQMQDQKGATEFIKSLAFAGKDITQFTRGFLEYLRLVLYVKMGAVIPEDLGLVSEDAASLAKSAADLGNARLLEIIKRILEAYRDTKNSPVAELPLLVAALALTAQQNETSKPAPGTAQSTGAQQAPKVVPVEKPVAGLTSSAPGQVDLSMIIARWSDVLSKVKEYNHSLISSLRVGRLVSVDESTLVMAFPYSFHRDTIDARKNRLVLEQVLEEIFSCSMKLRAVLEKDVPANAAPAVGESPAAGTDLLGEALRVMGDLGAK